MYSLKSVHSNTTGTPKNCMGQEALIFVIMVAISRAYFNLRLWTQTEQQQEESLDDGVKIDIPSDGISSEITIQIEPNEFAEERGQLSEDIYQANVALSDFAPDPINQLLIEGRVENSSSHVHSLPEEGVAQQTTCADDGINNTVATSQNAEQQTMAIAISENQVPTPDFKTAVKVALLVISISVAGIIGAVSGVMEKKIHSHTRLFKAYEGLCSISFFTGVVLLFLTSIPKELPGLVTIVKVTMWITLGSITFAIGCACIILLKS